MKVTNLFQFKSAMITAHTLLVAKHDEQYESGKHRTHEIGRHLIKHYETPDQDGYFSIEFCDVEVTHGTDGRITIVYNAEDPLTFDIKTWAEKLVRVLSYPTPSDD